MIQSKATPRVIVIGAGVGGLSAAAVLAKAGMEVTVLEAHVYPGGCAGTFYHKGYRFDAGATVAGGFYAGGPMDLVAHATGVSRWPIHSSANHDEPAMVVHLPDGETVTRWGDERRFAEYQRVFGSQAQKFWRWQEQTADALWQLALRLPVWPPQSAAEVAQLLASGAGWLASNPKAHLKPSLIADAWCTVAAHLVKAPERLRWFVDAQLLIAAQTISSQANALYGASALDLPRRGIVHLSGGIGAIATTLADAIDKHGGRVLLRQTVTSVATGGQRAAFVVKTKRGDEFEADLVIANLPPWNIAKLFGTDTPPSLQQLPTLPDDAWGAFMLYVGVSAAQIPANLPLHHQVIKGQPNGEGNTIFLSLSPAEDTQRAPAGKRTLTISTHTRLPTWWQLCQSDEKEYEQHKLDYANNMIATAEQAIPGLRQAATLMLPGTPVTFERFTRRLSGWVGGFPQTSLWRMWGPRLAPNVWMVGDSIFPGQSTAAVALGGLRVAHSILRAA